MIIGFLETDEINLGHGNRLVLLRILFTHGSVGYSKKRETALKDKQKQPQPPVSKLMLIKLSMWYIPGNMIYFFIYLFFIYFNLFVLFWERGKLVLI